MSNKRNPGIKRANVPVEYTREMILEMNKCALDPIHFIENYIYIKHPKRGKIKFLLYDYQKDMVRKYHKQEFCITLASRQVGKTETTSAFILWFSIFHSEKTVLIASNKSTNAMEVMAKIQYMYEELPHWIKPGIDENSWNKHTAAFDNKTRIVATTTSKDSGRGLAISLLYCDEFAFVSPHIAQEFWDSILPTISQGGRMIISSTPNGDIGKYAELWRGAQAGLNEFKDGITFVPWNAPPGRDEAFRQKFMGLLGQRKWLQEYECHFLSEELTLIDSALITQREKAIQLKIEANDLYKFSVNQNKFNFFKKLRKDMIYLVGVDPCTGNGNDNGVIQVFEFPTMEQVLEYATNTLSPQVMYTELKSVLNFLCQISEEVYFSVENNGVGQGVLAAYEGDMSPPNAMLISDNTKTPGVNSNAKTKLRACIQFKENFERDKIIINSIDMLKELKSFVRDGGSYAAQTGATDDRIMATIVVFYMIQQLASNNGSAYDMIYSVAEEIEKRHAWTNNDTNSEQHNEQIVERSEILNTLFESSHSMAGRKGFILG